MPSPTSLRDALAGPNGLNAVRLVLASLVLVSHCWPLSGAGGDPAFGKTSLGTFCVAGFFAISGYLITGSRLKLGLGRFMWHRALRIYPGYWVMLVVVAFVLAPIVSAVAGEHWTATAAARHVATTWTTHISDFTIPGTLENTAFLPAWNGSAWTLWYELVCYVAVGAAMTVLRGRAAVAGVSVITVLVCAANLRSGLLGPADPYFHLGSWFAAGALLRMLGDRVPLRADLAAFAAVVVAGTTYLAQLDTVGAVPLAYLVLWVGATWKARLGTDLSYGVYIYAFPVQQVLANFGVRSPLLMLAMAAPVVAGAAWVSWTFVERPALGLKSLPWPRRSAAAERRADQVLG